MKLEEKDMGLIRAAMKAAGSTMADQWKEEFCCDALNADILAAKGEKRTSGESFAQRERAISLRTALISPWPRVSA